MDEIQLQFKVNGTIGGRDTKTSKTIKYNRIRNDV